MSLRRATSVAEYGEWVRQSVFEVGDLCDCLEYEPEELSKCPAFLDPREEGTNAVCQSMRDGAYGFGREDRPFTDLVGRYAGEVPFHTLLKQINETHRRGIDVEGEER
jgi:hypothetical protein